MNICTLYICIFIIFYKFYLVFMYLTIHDMEKLKIDSRYDSCFDNDGGEILMFAMDVCLCFIIIIICNEQLWYMFMFNCVL